jgi:uncharacterized protein (TIGR00730 family)
MIKNTITFFCSGKTNLKEEYNENITKLIKKIDINKTSIAYGGGRVGLMGIVRDTFIAMNGTIISSNMRIFKEEDIEDDYLFDNIDQRQKKLVELGDAYVILPGGFGTLFELFEVITKNQIGEASKPIFIYNYNNVYDNLVLLIEKLIEEKFIKNNFANYKIEFFTNYDDLAERINNLDTTI